MNPFVGSKNGWSFTILDGLREDGVAVIIIQNKQIVVAGAGWGDELSRLIRVGLASGLDDRRELTLGTNLFRIEGFRKWIIVKIGAWW